MAAFDNFFLVKVCELINFERFNAVRKDHFLAMQTKSNRFIHDNFDFSSKKGIWHYAFHPDTLPISDISKIGIAANDKFGNTCIIRLKFKNSNKAIFF